MDFKLYFIPPSARGRTKNVTRSSQPKPKPNKQSVVPSHLEQYFTAPTPKLQTKKHSKVPPKAPPRILGQCYVVIGYDKPFKGRYYTNPIAVPSGLVTGQIYIYIRDNYPALFKLLRDGHFRGHIVSLAETGVK